MSTSRTVTLIYGWKLELGDLRNDSDVIYDTMNDLYGLKMKMFSDIDLNDGGDIYFGFGKDTKYEEYSVSVELDEIQAGLRDNLEAVMKGIEHEGMRIVMEMAMQSPAKLFAVMQVSY